MNLFKTLFAICIINAQIHYLFSQDNSIYGYKHTPQGELHMLIIFAEISGSTVTMDDWDSGEIPSWGYDLFESDVAEIGNNDNLSKYYYEMTKYTSDPFKVTADVYPNLVIVPNKILSEVYTWISANDGSFPWENYDSRPNFSDWQSDNSYSSPDNYVDYVVVIYRDVNSNGSDGGYASIGSGTVTTNSTGTLKTFYIREGHVHDSNQGNYWSNALLFVHEFSHEIWRAPHRMAANTVVDQKYETYFGWGMMSHNHGPFKDANAWEKWWAGWLPNLTTIENDVANNGSYYLGDLNEDGEAIRIEIPNTTNTYLWIENRQKTNAYLDERWETSSYTYLPTMNAGIYMYISNGGSNRSNIDVSASPGHSNQFKVLHGDGNRDYEYKFEEYIPGYGNQSVFEIGEDNPISSSNDFTSIRGDYDTEDGIDLIYIESNYNLGTGNEVKGISKEYSGGTTSNTYNHFGKPGAEFSVGDVLGLDGVIPILDFVDFDYTNDKTGNLLLN